MNAAGVVGRARLALPGLVLLAGMVTPPPLEAQYFGRNKVQYDDFAFQVLETEHFQVYYYDGIREAATEAARMAERWYARLSELFGHELTGKQPLILYGSHREFSQTTAIPGEIGEGTGGVTEFLKRRIVLPIAGTRAQTDHVIGHELVHAFQVDLAGVAPTRPLFGAPTVAGMPLWVMEGLAEYFSVGVESPITAMWLRDGLAHDRLPGIRDLFDDREFFPYRWGHAFWAYVGGRWGEDTAWRVFRTALALRSPAAAIDSVLGVHPDTLSAAWHGAIRAAYGGEALRDVTTTAESIATPLVTEDRTGRALNLGPAISPDGRRFLFLSSRDPFAIDLYLADAETGEVMRRLTQTELDPHYQSLQFVNSSGAWASDNERIAFTALSGGRPALVLMNAGSGDRLRTYRLERFGEVVNPTWSPDGNRIAFAGSEGGRYDLWVMDLASGDLRRLTEDAKATLQPDWSPDGRWIAFASEGADGRFGLALIDPVSGSRREVPTYRGADNINPRWSPDGLSLYFVSNVGGIPNLHRTGLAGRAVQVTRLFTGVNGLTELSPAFDLARGTGRLVFTTFERGNHHLYRLDQPEAIAGTAARPGENAARLPPLTRTDRRLAARLDEGPEALPSVDGLEQDAYGPSLSLDYVSPPTLGFAVSSSGSFIGGGIALYFSDMLGYYELGTQFQAQVVNGNVLNGLGGLATFVSRRHRWHWGVTGGQVPYLTQAFGQTLVDLDGQGTPGLLQETLRLWTISRHAIGMFQYPFSPTQRLELSGGFERVSFDAESDQRLFALPSGLLLEERRVDVPGCGDTLSVRRNLCVPGAMNQFRGAAALVRDNVIHGFTGPIAGLRYRFEVAPSFGTLNYVGLLGDWRWYTRVASPVTLATRLLHYGRYGADAEDDRLRQLFLGFPSLLRGYDPGSFSVAECPPGEPIDQCSEILVFDRLFGSRLALGNAELRISLFGPVGVLGRTFPLPVDLVGFFDTGVAWFDQDPATPGVDERAFFLGGDRDLLSSAGAGLRFNLLGFALAEVHWVRPFARPARGGHVQFALNTGF